MSQDFRIVGGMVRTDFISGYKLLPLSHAGQDYTVQNPRGFTIGRGGFTPTNEVCFDVLTNNDLVSEGTETAVFQLLLSTEVAWVELDMPEEALTELIILDNDCELWQSFLIRSPYILRLRIRAPISDVSCHRVSQLYIWKRCPNSNFHTLSSCNYTVVIVEFGHISYAVTEGSFGYISLCIVVNGMTNRHPQPTLHISTTSVSAVGKKLSCV